MNKTTAQTSIKNVQTELFKLESSALIQLFEIDVSNLADQRQIILSPSDQIFRFHNQIKLTTTDIYFNNNQYIAAPIQAENFEVTSQGTLPTPTLRMVVNDAAIPLLAQLKDTIKFFGDIVGAKVTRRRTFAKFLDAASFPQGNYPDNWEPDNFAEMVPDVYYINRKTKENKLTIEYELNSILDVQGIQLPRRPIIARTCPFAYRGEGCLYEYEQFKNDNIHGESSILPKFAPPIATDDDKLISDLIGTNITFIGKWNPNITYQKGQAVYLTFQGINYYFVASQNNVTVGPFDTNFWIQDKCSKHVSGCKLRWGTDGAVNVSETPLIKGELPFGGFPSTERLRTQ